MLGAPAGHFERLRRKNEEPAGKQRDQRKHVQVDAIRAREIGALLFQLLDFRHRSAGRQQRGDLLAHCCSVGARRETQVDAVQHADPAEAPLRRGNVGQRGAAPQPRHDPGDFELDARAAEEQRELVALREL